MRSEKFNNILNGNGIATSSDFSADEKRFMFSVMEKYGMSVVTANYRFFRDGFSEWEMKGIRALIEEFVEDEGINIDFEDRIPSFYHSLPRKETFKDFMEKQGMCRKTAVVRFSQDNFKPWELIGVKQIIESYILNETTD